MGKMADLAAKLRDNPHAKQLMHSFKNDESLQLDVPALVSEVVNLHATRPVKTLTMKRATEDALGRANIADQRTRSQLVKILGEVNGVWNQLDTQLAMTREVLYLRYTGSFQEYRHRVDKERVTNVLVFQELIVYLASLKALSERITTILDDIDRAGFMLQRQVTVFVHSSQRRNTERSVG